MFPETVRMNAVGDAQGMHGEIHNEFIQGSVRMNTQELYGEIHNEFIQGTVRANNPGDIRVIIPGNLRENNPEKHAGKYTGKPYG